MCFFWIEKNNDIKESKSVKKEEHGNKKIETQISKLLEEFANDYSRFYEIRISIIRKLNF